MELLYVFNESVSAVGEIFAQHLSKAFRSSSPGHQHADITGLWRDLDWFLLISFFQQVSLCFRIISMLKHPLPYLFYSVNCGLLLHFLHPNRFCILLDSIINKCMHLKVFVNYCTLVTFRAVVTDVGIFFSRCFVVKPFWCLRNVHYYMINLMTSHLMMVYMWWVNNMGL